MQRTRAVRPAYVEKFKCIGPDCEDSCCAGWHVDIDKATYDKYQAVPAGPLRTLMDANIERKPKDAQAWVAFARVKLLPSAECPFHNAEKLCQIQVELGEEYLSHTCSTYPRRSMTIDNLADKTLTFSCPEACRLLLLNPDLLNPRGGEEKFIAWEDTKDDRSLVSYFWPIREFVVGLMRNREYELWQRMFLFGTFARRLEAFARGEVKGGFAAMLRGFSTAVASGGLRAQIETLPSDLTLQLGMVLELVKLRSSQTALSPRLSECMDAFSQGIGHGPDATLETMSAAYGAAYQQYFAPFFAQRPHIFENYLINMIFRRLTPFSIPTNGKLLDRAARPEPAKEFALLATDFALVKGLLIGVAGGHREAFSEEHVVHTVQSVAKHFEHNSEFVTNAHRVLVEKKLDNAHGLTMLLRN